MEQPDEFTPRMSDTEFEAFLQLCQEQYLEMKANGTWPWPDDSPNPEDLVES